MIKKVSYENGLELLDSATFIHLQPDKPVTISITENASEEFLHIRIEFVFDPEVKKATAKLSNYNKMTVKLTVTHYGRLQNFGYKEAIPIGKFDGRQLWFNFRINMSNQMDSPSITYSWFVGKEVKK